MGFF
jgi:hypothetical protein